MSDERLRAIYTRLLARAPGSAAEPSADALLALAEGERPEAERLATLDRVMRSEGTRRDFELLRAALAASRPRRDLRRLAYPMLGVAALLLIAVGVTELRRQRGADANPMRGVAQAIALATPEDSPSLAGPLVFSWRRVPEATSYELELVEATGALVHVATMSDTTWTPPASVHLASGVEYRWWVRAHLADGTTREAPPRRLVLSP